MNKLEEMKNSCKVFAADLKTGNVEWTKHSKGNECFNCIVSDINLQIWLDCAIECFALMKPDKSIIRLQSTTAKEAAQEALQLVRAEAQKLVDALSVEPKETDLQENNSWFYVRKTLGQVKDSLQAFTKKTQHLTDSVAANHFRDLEKAIVEVDKMGVELKKHNALSEPKEPFWIPIDYNNLPRMKVIVKTGYGDYIEGIIETDSGNGLDYILCSNTKERYYTTFTHYHDISKYPKPQ